MLDDEAMRVVLLPNVTISADGSCTVYCGTVDMGQGSTTAMAQIAAETLGIEAEAVRVVMPDTDVTPYDMGTLGSRSLFHMGHAVRIAAEEALAKLAALAAETSVPPGTNRPIAELFRRNAACKPAPSRAAAATSRATFRRIPKPG
jgi:CO/xanthine dehydrogenase Mo-binding subunit